MPERFKHVFYDTDELESACMARPQAANDNPIIDKGFVITYYGATSIIHGSIVMYGLCVSKSNNNTIGAGCYNTIGAGCYNAIDLRQNYDALCI